MANVEAMERFRKQYRGSIGSGYNGHLHMWSVVFIGGMVITYSLIQLGPVLVSEYWTIAITLVLVNFAEYASHRWLGHKKTVVAKLFYSRHTGDHHSFFEHGHMAYVFVRDWRVVLFPVYLIVAFVIGLVLPLGFFLNEMFSANVAYLYAATAIGGYLFYEVMHFSYHLPKGSVIERIPVWKTLRKMHEIHHQRDLMTQCNFNITIPLFDLVFGSLKIEPDKK